MNDLIALKISDLMVLMRYLRTEIKCTGEECTKLGTTSTRWIPEGKEPRHELLRFVSVTKFKAIRTFPPRVIGIN